jgi:hypothetical protein
MTAPTIIPITNLTGTDDPAYQVSKNVWNAGPFKLHASQSCVLIKTGGAGDVVELALSGNATDYLDGTGAWSVPAGGGGGGGGYSPTDYISGLVVTKHSGANTLDISAGAYYDPANATVQTFAAQTAVAAGTLGNSQWNQVYITGTSTIVVTNNADPPSSVYMGSARKDGSNRRWIGSFRTTSSANIVDQFANDCGNWVEVIHKVSPAASGRVLSAGTATTWTAVSLAAVVPKYATIAGLLTVYCSAAAGSTHVQVGIDGANEVSTLHCPGGTGFTSATNWLPIDRATPQVYYIDDISAATAYIDVGGYRIAR